nr:hypothetical protein DA06_24790 [Georgenia sp. SUBG003]KEP23592.1 hypothetical protein DA06_06870 [Georgenia sp. SUBG003]
MSTGPKLLPIESGFDSAEIKGDALEGLLNHWMLTQGGFRLSAIELNILLQLLRRVICRLV